MTPIPVFVYGTLQRGQRNHHILRNSRFIGAGETVARCRLFNAGFPVLRDGHEDQPNQNAPVRGEVFEVADPEILRALDALEGEGRMYHRRIKYVRMEDGATVKAHTYVGDTRFWRASMVDLLPMKNGQYVWPVRPIPADDWRD